MTFDFWRYFIEKFPEFFSGSSRYGFVEDIIPTRRKKLKQMYKSSNCYINFNDKEIEKGEKWIQNRLGGKQFVCIFTRDEAYYKQNANAWSSLTNTDFSGSLRSINGIRDTNINVFDAMADDFKRHDIWCVRMGAISSAVYIKDGVIDYVNEDRTEFLDVWLNSQCQFFIGNLSGAAHFTELFSKPVALLSPTVLQPKNDLAYLLDYDRDLMIFQKYRDKDTGKLLTLRQMMKLEENSLTLPSKLLFTGMASVADSYLATATVVPYTQKEILDLADEMKDKVNGVVFYDEVDIELQNKYWSILRETNKDIGDVMPARIGRDFLRENQWWLE